VNTYGDQVAMSSSFQQQSLVLLHMASQVAPHLPIFFVDTGHHFPETLAFKEQVTRWLGLQVIDLYPEVSCERQEMLYGPELWVHNPDLCCYLNKVRPMWNALRLYRAWITGIRRDQSPQRAQAEAVEYRHDNLVKINPLIAWTRADIERYIALHELPTHPLHARGYQSIGCAPCTRPTREGEKERAGRWPGTGKQECGLHTLFRAR
jgi:phosphoadenosine phosphosulfate reductase